MQKTIYTREYEIVRRLLQAARKSAGLTQTALGKKLGLTQSFVTKVERGERRLDIVQLRTMCEALGLSLKEFVRRLDRELMTGK